MDIRRTILVGIALVLTALMAACAAAAQDQPPAQGAALLDTEWVLVSLNGGDLMEGKAITLRFGEASIEGSGGCNTYGGRYTASEDSLSLSGVYWTEMACSEPKGVMDQEQAYFQTLNAAAGYRVDGDRLELYDEASAQVLMFTAADSPSATQTTPSPVQPTATAVAAATPTRVLPTATLTATATPEPPTATPAVPEPPAGSKQYVDAASGVSLWVPESWTIVEPGPHGGPTILQSFPVDKYVGGEPLQQGDTKCDLTIHPPDISVADVVQQVKSDPSITIVSEQEIVLQSGRTGTRMEVESMGRSLVLFAEANERAVVLTCFGKVEPFDEIAVTLSVSQESSLIATIEAQESLPTGAVVKVRFTLTNTLSEGFFVLKWFTPLEGLAGDIFRVQRDGVDLAYRGKLVKRGPPISDDYVWIDAGGSISAEVDLAKGYDFSQAGQYTLQFRSPRLSHTAKTSREQADSIDELEMIWIPSSPVTVTIGRPSGS